jgi:hypothetical protein
MIGVLISLIIVVLVIGFLFWAFQQLLPLIPVAEPFTTILRILVAGIILIVVIWFIMVLLGYAGVQVGGPFLPHRID